MGAPHILVVKPPQPSHGFTAEEDDEAERDSGRLSQSEFAAWFGNSIILASLGTIALFIDRDRCSKQIEAVSIVFISLAIAITLWASYKFFGLARSQHHWTEAVLAFIVIVALAAFVWFAILV